jgi:hypothetical protein
MLQNTARTTIIPSAPLGRALPRGLTVFVSSICLAIGSFTAAHAQQSSPAAKTAEVDGADRMDRHPWPGDERRHLVLPDALWRHVLDAVDHADAPLGYPQDIMDHYTPSLHRLRSVDLLFRDAAALARESGRITDGFLAAAGGTLSSHPAHPSRGEAVPGPAEVVRQAFVLTDVRAGRGHRVSGFDQESVAGGSGGWGVDWIPPGASPAEALDHILAWRPTDDPSAIHPAPALTLGDRTRWLNLPPEVQRLVVRLFIAAAEAQPWLDAALDETDAAARRALGARDSGPIDPNALVRLLHLPWDEAVEPPSTPRELGRSVRLLDTVDRPALAHGAIVLLSHLQRAIDEHRAWSGTEAGLDALGALVSAEPFAVETALGRIRILGPGDEHVRTDDSAHDLFIIDLGGATRYEGRLAAGLGPDRRIGAVIDFGGDDVYASDDETASLGCGAMGVGLVWDAGGNDVYRVHASGLASAWCGVGLLVDAAGDDEYRVQRAWGQAHAVCGVSALIDLAGDDVYSCGYESQAHGSTLGAAVLLDLAGDDEYIARDDGRVSALYLDQSVAMAQGCGHGRRADLDPGGHSLAGGWGVLVDGAGDDRYHSQVWSQGAGYWWGVGILEDRGGHDHYRNGKYSMGAAAHFAIGVHVDQAGDDRYNIGNDTAVNQFQGHARDGSIGAFIDGDGDDRYFLRNHCAGSSDLGSIGLFWDRRGDDRYDYAPNDFGAPNGWNETPPLGSSTVYDPHRSFRDETRSNGVFLDTGGEDEYPEPPRGGPRWANDAQWSRNAGPIDWSLGWDLQWWRRQSDPPPRFRLPR